MEWYWRPQRFDPVWRSLKQHLALTWGTHRSFPAPHVSTWLESALRHIHSSTGVSPGRPSPSSCPPQQSPHTQLSRNGEAFAQVWLSFFLLFLQSSGSRRWGWGLSQGILQLPCLRIKMYFILHPDGHALPLLGSSTIYSKLQGPNHLPWKSFGLKQGQVQDNSYFPSKINH